MKRRRGEWGRPKGDKDRDKDRDEDRPKGDPLQTRLERNEDEHRTDTRDTRIVLHATGIALWDRLNSIIELAKS
jgi:hypothetical protein